jgi:hypothetical protein
MGSVAKISAVKGLPYGIQKLGFVVEATGIVLLRVVPFNSDVRSQIMMAIDVLDRNRAVLDLVASDHVLEILHGRVTQRLGFWRFRRLDLSLREAFFVLGDGVNESKAWADLGS